MFLNYFAQHIDGYINFFLIETIVHDLPSLLSRDCDCSGHFSSHPPVSGLDLDFALSKIRLAWSVI